MTTYFFEVEHTMNWGKFCVAKFAPEEWKIKSNVDIDRRLIASQGWNGNHIWVMDLATGEGACFLPGGYVKSDLNKHRIWVCPMFEPFLEWLYKQDLSKLDELPKVLHLTEDDVPGAMAGYRRPCRVCLLKCKACDGFYNKFVHKTI